MNLFVHFSNLCLTHEGAVRLKGVYTHTHTRWIFLHTLMAFVEETILRHQCVLPERCVGFTVPLTCVRSIMITFTELPMDCCMHLKLSSVFQYCTHFNPDSAFTYCGSIFLWISSILQFVPNINVPHYWFCSSCDFISLANKSLSLYTSDFDIYYLFCIQVPGYLFQRSCLDPWAKPLGMGKR